MATKNEAVNRLKEFCNQIDEARLRNAIEFVDRMGSGTQVFYRQEIAEPYLTDIYITVRLKSDMWETTAHKYGGIYFPEMSQAIILMADGILRALPPNKANERD